MSTEELLQNELLEAELAETQKKVPASATYGMVKNYVEICHALGINTRNLDPMDLYLTTGKVFDALRPIALERNFIGQSINLIKSLTKEQRLAIREKVVGVVQLPGKR
jgi:hypothetical protein